MATKIFVNLPVKDLSKSKNFYTALGYSINEQFSDDTGACVVISDEIYIMILTHEKFKQFTDKQIADAHKTVQVLNALSFDNKTEVDNIFEKAVANGGSEARPKEDLGFMYTRPFTDPDGHVWEPFFMDMSAVPPQS